VALHLVEALDEFLQRDAPVAAHAVDIDEGLLDIRVPTDEELHTLSFLKVFQEEVRHC